MNSDYIPVVSSVVPARNEEACLGACLESLVAQTGIAFEIIVVDDDSTDCTAEIARSFANREKEGVTREGTASAVPERAFFDQRGFSPLVTVIPAPALPDHWTGKNNAMSAGAKVAHTKAKWLLFTDADTVHKPGSLARAVAEAEQHGASLLSYSPEQEVRGFWEKAVMPVIFAELAATYPPKKVNDPASPIAAANGQYLLISREAYDAVGGHTKIASELLEDVALALLVKRSGRKIFFRYGAEAVRTRMYRSFAQMKEGWTKNLALLFRNPVRRTLMLLAFWMLSWIAFALGLAAILSGYWRAAYYVLPMFFLYGRIAWGRFPPKDNLVAIAFGVPTAAYLLIRSVAARSSGAVNWKGRKYDPSRDGADNALFAARTGS